jgi:hypothetical protein
MRKFILMIAIFACTFVGFSQEKGTTQVSALSVTSDADASLLSLISTPELTHYCFDNIGFTLGVANLEEINIGARYYAKDNNFAFAGYGTGSETVDLGVGKTLSWTDNVKVEPRLTLSDVLNDTRDLALSLHLNLVF